MIWHPTPGQTIRVHYRKSAVRFMRMHGWIGKVCRVGTGPGPINVLVLFKFPLPDKILTEFAVIPRGNLVAL